MIWLKETLRIDNPILFLLFLVAGALLVTIEMQWNKRHAKPCNVTQFVLVIVALLNILFIFFLMFNHARFPLHLTVTEGVVLQSFQRATEFVSIYTEPSPEYITWSYNPLFYLIAIPFSWIFGVNLFTLRFVAMLGMFGSGLILYRVTKQKTGSMWWGLIAAGLFAAAYYAMDSHLDSAHPDSMVLFSALLGSYIIDRYQSPLSRLLGIVILCSAFWFKQNGALFAIGGVLFLTWRNGLKHSIQYWVIAAFLGPLLYLFAGPALFGTYFHFFTWEVPGGWTEINFFAFARCLYNIFRYYPILFISGISLIVWTFIREQKLITIWHFQFIAAALISLIGTFDPESSNNNFIAIGAWSILVGILGIHQMIIRWHITRRYQMHMVGLFIAFATLIYNPLTVIVSPLCQESYADFVDLLKGLKGNVYAPSVMYMQHYNLYPTPGWALEDIIRGPNRDIKNHPITHKILDPIINPKGPAFIFTNRPMKWYKYIAFLENYYVLEKDYANRFKPLSSLPSRGNHAWPRYLYRFNTPEYASK